jgi:hypothetical protein
METKLALLQERQEEAESALLKLAKKAVRFGCSDISWNWGEKFIDKYKEQIGFDEFVTRRIPKIWLTVTGEAPKVGDYDFVARLELTPAGTLVCAVPGQEVPEQFLHADGHCDHCKTNRRRNDVFVVRDSAGNHLQVGRQCLQDFLGKSPAQVLARLEFFKKLEGFTDEYGTGGTWYVFDSLKLLTYSATTIRKFGWVSKGMVVEAEARGEERLTSTSTRVSGAMAKGDEYAWFVKSIKNEVNDADKKLAADTLAWARGLNTNNDYLHNLNTILSAPEIYRPRHVSLAVSAVPAYLREQKRQEELLVKKASAEQSCHVGKVGERLRNVPVKVEAVIGMPETQWGCSTLFKFVDQAGNRYAWFASGNRHDLSINEEIVITGTVKAHNVYNGINETQLSRVSSNPPLKQA